MSKGLNDRIEWTVVNKWLMRSENEEWEEQRRPHSKITFKL